jgi:dynein heavy chain
VCALQFENGIRNSQASEVITTRIENLNAYFTYLIYTNVCRSLFERHKLLFSFILTTRIMQGEGRVDALEWRFLISGQSPAKKEAPKPAVDWVTELMWSEICSMAGLPVFKDLELTFMQDLAQVRTPPCVSLSEWSVCVCVCACVCLLLLLELYVSCVCCRAVTLVVDDC